MTCVLLAERHHALGDGVRGLLEASFGFVFTVVDAMSLLEGAARLQPTLAVVDLALAGGDLPGLVAQLRERATATKLLLLSVHDEWTVAADVLAAGADGMLVKSRIADELLPAVDAILAGGRYVSAPVVRGAPLALATAAGSAPSDVSGRGVVR
ncbi:MAG: response regulator [Burkholderiales bacterium]